MISAETTPEAAPQLTLLWSTWELWCDLPSSASAASNLDSMRNLSSNAHLVADNDNWLNQVKSIGLFDSAEGFWGAHTCTVPPSRLPPNSSYYLFRKHIAPMWEHEANRRGGKWVLVFTLPSSATGDTNRADNAEPESLLPVDAAWQRLCLAAIGELFPCAEEEICGLTVSRGRTRVGKVSGTGVEEWKVCVWTRNADDEAAQMNVARFVGELLGADGPIADGTADTNAQTAAAAALDLSMSGEGSPSRPTAATSAATYTTPLKSKALNVPASATTPTPFKARSDVTSPAKLSLAYLAHRELMELKQRKHTKAAGAAAFGPKYAFSC